MEELKSEPLQLFFSSSRSVELNLAMEEFFLEIVAPKQQILFLYENDAAVIIGRFQNPWKECRTGTARRTGTAVRRRISGGGTVVHGPGNLNWSVISGGRLPEKEGNIDRVIAALEGLGISARRNNRYDVLLEVEGVWRKIAGSAFRQTSRGSLHHATLLVDADLDAIRRLLRLPQRDITARSVESTSSPVAKLSQRQAHLTVADVAAAIAGIWGAGSASLHRLNPENAVGEQGFDESLQRLVSDEWTWGRTPRFTERFHDLPGWGGMSLIVEVVGGRIASIETESPGNPAPGNLELLIGCPYHGPEILQRTTASESTRSGNLAPLWARVLASGVDGDAP